MKKKKKFLRTPVLLSVRTPSNVRRRIQEVSNSGHFLFFVKFALPQHMSTFCPVKLQNHMGNKCDFPKLETQSCMVLNYGHLIA